MVAQVQYQYTLVSNNWTIFITQNAPALMIILLIMVLIHLLFQEIRLLISID